MADAPEKKLATYRDKRDVAKTNEPLGLDERRRALGGKATAFVIHHHAATRRHFDLRLEIDGVLASFAIPHGISLNPADKHLAIHTEDHPLEYVDFEAVIPEGTYGAGPMIAWDVGRVRWLEPPQTSIQDGKLDFVLEGRKVRGHFALVKIKPGNARKKAESKGNEWLLLKKKDAHSSATRDIVAEQPASVFSGLTVEQLADAHARSERLVEDAIAAGAPVMKRSTPLGEPMKLTLGPLPEADGWIYELKVDGVRLVATKTQRDVELRYRTGRSATATYPEVARAVQALPVEHVVLDGEVAAFDEAGRPNFQRLGRRIHLARPHDVAQAITSVPVVYVVFDLLEVGDRDLRPLPLAVRKALLARLIPAPGVLRAIDYHEGAERGQRLLALCEEHGLEGVVAKKLDSTYSGGKRRSPDWIKRKTETESDFVVVGFTKGEGARELGALDIASYEGDDLVVRGKVGSGLDDATMDELLPELRRLAIGKKQISLRGKLGREKGGRTFVSPEIVVRVRYLSWSDGGTARFPVFLGIVHDKDPRTCREGPDGEGAPPEASIVESAPTIDDDSEPIESVRMDAPRAKITNRDKVFWPDEGLTKGDLIDFYTKIAPLLLPYLKDRPIMLVRYPDGITGKSFYQWNVPHGMPGWIRSVELAKHAYEADEASTRHKHVFLIDGLESLRYIANLACIPVHILGSRVGTPSECDFFTIDFDVGRSSLAVATRLAQALREVLEQVGLTGFAKTSGQSGLHVFVSLLGGKVAPRVARTMAELFGRWIVERFPKDATMERTVSRRGSRVYVDTGQTGPSRTIVAPFSVRATSGARVSTPLTWDEVHEGLDPAAHTIKTVPSRVVANGDPMAALLTTHVDLAHAMKSIEKLLRKA